MPLHAGIVPPQPPPPPLDERDELRDDEETEDGEDAFDDGVDPVVDVELLKVEEITEEDCDISEETDVWDSELEVLDEMVQDALQASGSVYISPTQVRPLFGIWQPYPSAVQQNTGGGLEKDEDSSEEKTEELEDD